ncbi:MAG: terminase large subunit [Erysipelotrichaceae bacterium]|nr:terminase large subunit [Erysipelotrichaceae bacterium]
MKRQKYLEVAKKYASDVISGNVVASDDVINACKRFQEDLERPDLVMKSEQPDQAISIIENIFVHKQGEAPDGTPLQGKPLKLEPWQIFIIYNLLGFWYKGTKERKYKEAWIMLGRKNGKTSFVAALAFAVALIQRKSGSKIYVVAAALKQALESFDFIMYSLRYKKIAGEFKIKDSYVEHSIKHSFDDGSIEIQILASNPDAQDSFNCNFAIADEVAAYKKPAQYNRFKEAMKAYTNKLMVGITTAGDNMNSFGYDRMQYAVKVAAGLIKDDAFFSFVARADVDEKGNCDYTNPVQHMKANPNYGITIRPQDIMNDALQAQNDPRQRKDFLSRSLNIYTAAMKAWFDIEEFRASDKKYSWTIEELSRLNINWYGGADLSRMYDLTAAALFGTYQGVDIIITHAFCPVVMAVHKSDEDNIPLYGWMDNGWLTMSNTPTVNAADIVNWFIAMRNKGFKIRQVGHDRKFAGEEYLPLMRKAGFNIIDQPQLYYLKSQGFRHIEKAAKDGKLYYLHSEAYEYCVSNVAAVEKTDDAVSYEKVEQTQRIDLFDASVFACVRSIEDTARNKAAQSWWGE